MSSPDKVNNVKFLTYEQRQIELLRDIKVVRDHAVELGLPIEEADDYAHLLLLKRKGQVALSVDERARMEAVEASIHILEQRSREQESAKENEIQRLVALGMTEPESRQFMSLASQIARGASLATDMKAKFELLLEQKRRLEAIQ